MYYLEPTGYNPDGIWTRKRSMLKLPEDQEIIRKSQFNTLQIVKNWDQQSLSKFLPKSLIKGYYDIIPQPKSIKQSSSKSSMYNTTDWFEEEMKETKTLYGIDNEVDLMNLEIVGTNKLLSEISAWNSIKGSKYIIKNHHFNELGEGEPEESVEIIEQCYL